MLSITLKKEDFDNKDRVSEFTSGMLAIIMTSDVSEVLSMTMVDTYVMTLVASKEDVFKYVKESGAFLNNDKNFRRMVELRCKMFDMINSGAESITIKQDEKFIATIS